MKDADPNHSVNSQKIKIQSGSPKIEIIAPCILNDGIIAIGEEEQNDLIEIFTTAERELLFFIPASGSGSRMFNFLLSSNSDEAFEKDQNVLRFLNELDNFAFFDEDVQIIYLKWKSGEIDSRTLINQILGEGGKSYLSSPKGLIPFHTVEEGSLNAFQEHILQGMKLMANDVSFHFTIQANHQNMFLLSLENLGQKFKNDYRVDFSFQDPGTDSYAFDQSLNTIKLQNGHLLKRPAGHGALLENLADLNNQFVLIKNIDNVQHLYSSEQSIELWKMLCGLLIKVKAEIAGDLS